MIDDRPVKAVIPGGSSAAMLTGDNLDIKMDFDTRELTFGFQDKDKFDPDAVKKALEAQRFPNAELLKGP